MRSELATLRESQGRKFARLSSDVYITASLSSLSPLSPILPYPSFTLLTPSPTSSPKTAVFPFPNIYLILGHFLCCSSASPSIHSLISSSSSHSAPSPAPFRPPLLHICPTGRDMSCVPKHPLPLVLLKCGTLQGFYRVT